MAETVDLERFRRKVREYRLLVNRTQADLAGYLNLDYNELSNRFNAHKNTRLTHESIRAIVRALAEWGAITTRGQADDLLNLMGCPHFDPVDWQAKPLSKLSNTSASLATSNSTTPKVEPITSSPAAPPLIQQKATPLHNLPQPVSSFIGRQTDVAELTQILGQKKTRLVTLIGAGGCGKTRLSLQVAERLLKQFRDGVWFIELAPLSDSTLISQTIATALGVVEQAGRSILVSLSDYLRSRQLLLVLDNCEHLIGECAGVVNTLLTASGELQILASSREGLVISGETLFRVPSLTLPDPHNLPEVATLLEYEAVRLFQERAQAVSPTFSITNQNAETVMKLCNRLDGIPLAIELAAARIKVLRVEQIATRLDDRFRLLTGGSRTALPRQQTLRALVDWSYDLLSPAEKRLMSHLSVFAAGWSLSAAEAVCISRPDAEKGLEEYEVLEALSGLVNKSLVQVEEYGDSGEEARYHFLETLRQYGLEKLKAGIEEQEVRERYLTYYVSLALDIGTKIHGHKQQEIFKLLDKELDNLRAALDYGLENEQFEAIIDLADHIYMYWDTRGYYSELRRYLKQALAWPSAIGVRRGLALYMIGFLAARMGDLQSSHAYYIECMRLNREYNNKRLAMYANGGLGLMYLSQGNYAEARRYAETNLELIEGTSEEARFLTAAVQSNLGMALMDLGEYEEASRLLETVQVSARELGHFWLLILNFLYQARLALLLENYAQAQQFVEEALSKSEEINFHLGKSAALILLGKVFYNEGRFKEARQVLEESLALAWQGTNFGSASELWVGVAGLLSKVWLEKKTPGILAQIACLCGAISAWTTSREIILTLPDRNYYKQALVIARSNMEAATFEAAFAEGQKMSIDETVAFSRQALSYI